MSALTSVLLSLAQHDAKAARARGTSELLERVINAAFDCRLEEVERRNALMDVYRELVQPGPPLKPEQSARVEALIAGGSGR